MCEQLPDDRVEVDVPAENDVRAVFLQRGEAHACHVDLHGGFVLGPSANRQPGPVVQEGDVTRIEDHRPVAPVGGHPGPAPGHRDELQWMVEGSLGDPRPVHGEAARHQSLDLDEVEHPGQRVAAHGYTIAHSGRPSKKTG